MGYRDQMEIREAALVAPWIGGRSIGLGARRWHIRGGLPAEPGWYRFRRAGRRAEVEGPAAPEPERLEGRVVGYLAGDRFLPEDAPASEPTAERVHLVEPGLERFARVSAGRAQPGGPLVFGEEELPLGPEDAARAAFVDGAASLAGVAGVPPGLDAAFRLLRSRQARRRTEALARSLDSGAGRRRMAATDFEAAAKAALAVGGARYLDHRPTAVEGEVAVQFRLLGRRFECTCDARTLRIVDAGVCLTDEATDERGDARFTLESLPGVIQQADREGVLVVFRHV